jgi:mannitol/fructose-specific phosphotransferase system IIA component (Ntr-type)
MRITEFLVQPSIRVPLRGATKEEVIKELVDVVCQDHDRAVADYVLQSVLERERVMSSGIGRGIAIPHGFSPQAISFSAALGIADEPIPFDSIDGKPVKLVFLLVSCDDHTNTKLKALARISRFLHREDFRIALSECTSTEQAMNVIAEEESRHRI